MFKHTELLDSIKHQHLKLTPINDFNFAKQQILAPISYTEIMLAAREYAIVFPKTTEGESNGLPVIVLGLHKTNQFVNAQGQWTAQYIPAHVRRYPFILGNNGQTDSFNVMIDTDSPNLSTEQGEALFDKEANQTQTLKNIVHFLSVFQQESMATNAFVKSLRDADVLTERQIQQQIDGKDHVSLVGFEVIDQDKLNAVSDSQFIEWRKQGFLPLIYALLASLDNIKQLA